MIVVEVKINSSVVIPHLIFYELKNICIKIRKIAYFKFVKSLLDITVELINLV